MEKNTKNDKNYINRAKFILLLFFCAVVFVFLLLFIIKNSISYSFIENSFNKFCGLKLELINPNTDFNLYADIKFKADKVNIYNENKTTKFLEISNLNLQVKPFGFVLKKANIKNLSSDFVRLYLYKDKNGKFELFEILKNKDFKFLKDNKITLTRLDSNIKNIEIEYQCDYKIQSKIKLKFYDTKINLSKKKKIFKLSQEGFIETTIQSKTQTSKISSNIESKYPFSNSKSKDLKLNIKLDDFNLYVLNDLAKKYISKDIIALLGLVDVEISTKENSQGLISNLRNLKIRLNNKKTITPYKKDIVTKILFNLDKDTLVIDKFNLSSNELDVSSFGVIKKIFSKKPEVNLQNEIKNTQLNHFIYLIPDNLIYYNLKGIPTLKKSNFFATIDSKTTLKLFPLNVEGNLKASNIYIPGYPKSFIQNDVNAYFMKDKVRIYARIYTPQNEYVTIDGISNMDDSLYGKYAVNSTKNIDLAYAKLYLVPVQQIIGFNIGPVPIMDISGFGNIDIKTQGTIFDAQIFGQFSARNASAKMEGLDALLNKGECELIFDNRNLIFKKVKGNLEGASFLLTGIGDTKGDVDLNVKIDNILTSKALKIFKNSLISKPYLPLIKDIAASSGSMNISTNLKGRIKNYEDKNLLNNLLLNGNLNFKNNKIILNNKLAIDKINGNLNFGDVQKADFDININNSKIKTKLNINYPLEKIAKGEMFDFNLFINSSKISSKDILNNLLETTLIDKKYHEIIKKLNNFSFDSKLNLSSYGKISLKNKDLSNIKHNGYLSCLNNEDSKIKFINGNIKFENTKMIFNDFLLLFEGGKAQIDGNIDKFLSKKPNNNLEILFENIPLGDLNKLLPNIKTNNTILKSGKITLKHGNLKLNNINITHDLMPVFLNAQIYDIYKTKYLSADFSTILNETTTDTIINPFLTYPLKIKGEVPIKGNFRGKTDNYSINMTAKIPKDSDISFIGANIGDINYNREISGKIDVNKNIATITNLKLIKFIKNQNNKINPLTVLKVDGKIKQQNNDFYYDNFKVLTMTPMNVRTLNMIFKKSLLKQGNFECAINLKDNIKTPKITGIVKLNDLDIPLYDTKINSIDVDIDEKLINGKILAKNKASDINLSFIAQNKLTTPYIVENLTIDSNKMYIQDILNSLSTQTSKNDVELKQELLIKPSDIAINKGYFSAKDVYYNKINAKNLKGEFDFKNNIFDLKNASFDIAQGNIKGSGKYNLISTNLEAKAQMQNCDSNILTKEFLNLSDQIFGKINGSIILSAKGLNTPDNIKNIKSNVDFLIYEGKMPKLGSLEYLLRAGNLIKNGLLGLSLNNLIQVLTPYKTGEFETITGKLTLGEGQVQNLEIKSKGKNLSLYLEGDYDILKNYADIRIYGRLSQNISNVLGNIGNASIRQIIDFLSPQKTKENRNKELNAILNKIPSVESQEANPKYFRAKVLGDINKDGYIKSFNWL